MVDPALQTQSAQPPAKKRSPANIILIVVLVVIVGIGVATYLYLGATESMTFFSDMEIGGRPTWSQTRTYYVHIKSESLCDLFGGEWTTNVGAWQKLTACYVK